MKYKNIDSMLHNFGHSFVSQMNFVDGAYIIDELYRLAKEIPGNELIIDFSSGQVSPASNYPERLQKAIRCWMNWLPKHIKSHNIEPSAIGPVFIRFRLVKSCQEVVVEATDDRGNSHKKSVRA